MLSWGRFRRSAPRLASAGRALLYRSGAGLALLGTVRADGAPRIHPVSPILVEDGLYALVSVSPKLGDLARDGRYALHTVPDDPRADAFHLAGRVAFPRDPGLRRTVAAAYLAERQLDAPPPPGFHRQVLVEFLVGGGLLSHNGQYVTWAAAPVECPA